MVERRKKENIPTRALLAHFDALHQTVLGVRAVIQGGKDAKLIAGLWTSHGEDMTRALMEDFFASDDPWIRDHGYTIGRFVAEAGKLLSRRQRRTPVQARTWKEDCAAVHEKRCAHAEIHYARVAHTKGQS